VLCTLLILLRISLDPATLFSLFPRRYDRKSTGSASDFREALIGRK